MKIKFNMLKKSTLELLQIISRENYESGLLTICDLDNILIQCDNKKQLNDRLNLRRKGKYNSRKEFFEAKRIISNYLIDNIRLYEGYREIIVTSLWEDLAGEGIDMSKEECAESADRILQLIFSIPSKPGESK